ncbi:heparan-alpha-glucosaminide N-acetyltransferase [Lepeophtheirus salmonis]|uniref:heparan-alpha-glucosaminide N-acetyltransferase n=1 Tax=Lepeophtheirus salmonis TaxID=72036 RepID=UPI001AE85240|nr:heparan-alpha-glucosaminide N-acetyltransferase-like [Lepeophtheirus salmonis]
MFGKLLVDKPRFCRGDRLGLNEACLESEDYSKVWIQNTECIKCPPWEYNFHPVLQQIKVNTSFPSRVIINNSKEYSKTECDFVYKFNDFGVYELMKDCRINFTDEGENIYLPIIWAVGIVISIKLLWVLIHRVYETQACRRLIVSIVMKLDPSGEIFSWEDGITFSSIDDDLRTSEVLTSDLIELRSRRARRLKSLDTFRGLSIAIMIFVNYGGGGYWFFKHSIWNGLTLADVVFPWFIWIMGVSSIISVQFQLRNSVPRGTLLRRVITRSVSLIALGLILNSSKGHNNVENLRFPGVLQRIGIAYLFTSIFAVYMLEREITTPPHAKYVKDLYVGRYNWIAIILLLSVNVGVSFFITVPGCVTGYLGPGGLHDGGKYFNCTGGSAGYIDRVVFGEKHMYHHPTSMKIYDSNVPFDPEGLLGTLTTSIVTAFLGCQAGIILIVYPFHLSRLWRWGIYCVTLGLFGGALTTFSFDGGVIPINKNLWSLSFFMITVSLAYLVMILMYVTVDVYKLWLGSPFRYAGMNPLFLYVGHEVLKNLLTF